MFNPLNLITKFIKSSNQKELDRISKIVKTINSLEDQFKKLDDLDFPKKTQEYKEQIKQGKTLDELLPEAFALVREASKRTRNERHFDVQIIGGVVLHEGKIAEMQTGEGKTLVATLPVYLNALTGLGPVNFELGVIAGSTNINPLGFLFFKGPNDSIVRVESTKVEGMNTHIVLPVTHTLMMRNNEVIDNTIHFLKTGQFIPDY